MSSFQCEKCGTDILDSPDGYTSGCDHWPLPPRLTAKQYVIKFEAERLLRKIKVKDFAKLLGVSCVTFHAWRAQEKKPMGARIDQCYFALFGVYPPAAPVRKKRYRRPSVPKSTKPVRTPFDLWPAAPWLIKVGHDQLSGGDASRYRVIKDRWL